MSYSSIPIFGAIGKYMERQFLLQSKVTNKEDYHAHIRDVLLSEFTAASIKLVLNNPRSPHATLVKILCPLLYQPDYSPKFNCIETV
jgi:hypothetical protein